MSDVIYLPHYSQAQSTVCVTVLGGSRWEEPSMNGISHLLEHVLLDPSVYEAERLGIEISGMTQRDSVRFVASGPPRHTKTMTDLLSGIVSSPSFDRSRLLTEKRIVREEILASTGWDLLEEEVKKSLWGDHPLGQSIAGDATQILDYTLDNVQDWYRSLFTSERVSMVVCSSKEPSDVALDLPSGSPLEACSAPETCVGDPVFQEAEEETYTVLLSWPVIPRSPVVHLLPDLLTNGYSSLLQSTLVTEFGFAYSLHADVDDYGDAASFDLSFETSPESFLPMCEMLMGVLSDWTPSVEEMHRARTMYMQARRVESESSEARASSLSDCIVAGSPLPCITGWNEDEFDDVFGSAPQVGIRGPLEDRILSKCPLLF